MSIERRNSIKRQAVLDAICSTDEHFSAERVYRQLNDEYPDISLGTVDRNIGVLLESGSIISVGNVNGEERYDGNTRAHAHFICTKCGAVIDIPSLLSPLQDYASVEMAIGGKVQSHSVTFTGVCADCSNS